MQFSCFRISIPWHSIGRFCISFLFYIYFTSNHNTYFGSFWNNLIIFGNNLKKRYLGRVIKYNVQQQRFEDVPLHLRYILAFCIRMSFSMNHSHFWTAHSPTLDVGPSNLSICVRACVRTYVRLFVVILEN